MSERNEQANYAEYKKQTERKMKIVVSILLGIFIFTLYFLLTSD
ncbi:MAG: hypothetical protein WCD45_02050 [Gallionella sp.]